MDIDRSLRKTLSFKSNLEVPFLYGNGKKSFCFLSLGALSALLLRELHVKEGMMAGVVEMAVTWTSRMLIKIFSSLTRETEEIGLMIIAWWGWRWGSLLLVFSFYSTFPQNRPNCRKPAQQGRQLQFSSQGTRISPGGGKIWERSRERFERTQRYFWKVK